MNRPPMMIIIVVAAIAFLAGRQFFKQRNEDQINDDAPVVTQQAMVVSKRDFPYPDRHTRQQQVIAGETLRYEVTFRRTPVGENFKVQMPETQYNACEPGATGALKMQGTRFISFTPGGR